MIILSLFDGMSCGQIALKELGVIPETYYASEIDKFAIAQTQLNFPNTIQLGSVVDIDVSKLGKIDLILGGSPCQSFSFAGKRKGMATACDIKITTIEQYLELKSDGFEFEGQSYLFWEYMRILTEIRKTNPDVIFLLENVEMGKKWESVLSEAIGLFGQHINSALVSAQNRRRIYWTNIRTRQEGLFGEVHTDIPIPEDRGILLRDILEDEVDEKYYLSDKVVRKLLAHTERHKEAGNGFGSKFHQSDEKMQALRVGGKGSGDRDVFCVALRGRNQGSPSDRQSGIPTEQRLEPNTIGKTNCLTSVAKDNLILQRARGYNKGGGGGTRTGLYSTNHRIRRLTPTECARLQTIPEWYQWECSDSQQYKMLGNGWTIGVIKHILSYLLINN